MSEIESFLAAEWWVPRWHCGYFPPWLIAWLVGVEFWIAVSYTRIPLTLFRLGAITSDGSGLISGHLAWMFGLFVLLCGWGHVFGSAVAFIWPHYVAFAMWHTLTAIVSHVTAGQTRNAVEHLKEQTEFSLNDLRDELRRMESPDLDGIAHRLDLLICKHRELRRDN